MANEEHLKIIEQGVEVWNQWREDNPDIKPDLKDAELIGLTLEGIDFSDTKLMEADLSNTNLSFATLRDADLTNGNFKNVNFSHASLLRTDFSLANLSGANFFKSILTQTNFRGATLREANLEVANFERDIPGQEGWNFSVILAGATFFQTNLRKANLSRQNLSRQTFRQANLIDANLSRVQAFETNFQEANLTGACIEDWSINNQTNLNNVICDYIYLKSNKKDRRPHDPNKNFAPGEFALLVQASVSTVDLIFSQGIDWQVFLDSFQNLQQEYEQVQLEIQEIKNYLGEFVIRVGVPANTDDEQKAKLEKSFWQQYEPLLKAKEEQIALLSGELEYKRQENTDLRVIIKTMAEQPKYDMRGSNFPGGFAETNYGKMVENQYNYTSQEKQSLAEAAAEIQKLLKQLEQTNPTATEAEKQAFVSAAMPPTRKQRLISAVTKGGQTALQEFLDNPYLNTAMAIIDGWRNPDIKS